MSIDEGLDRERIEELCAQILLAIKQNYIRGPVSQDRVFEALNALAFSAAWVIRACDDPEAIEFFSDALNKNLQTRSIRPEDHN